MIINDNISIQDKSIKASVRSFCIFSCFLIFTLSLQASSPNVNLTDQEKQWINAHPNIVIGTDESWEPMVIKNSDGSFSGIDADTVKHLNQILGTDITFKLDKWDLLNEELRQHQIDGLSSSSRAPQRAEYANYTDSYAVILKSIFVKKGNPLRIRRPEDLSGKRVAVQEGNLFDEKLVRRYKNVEIVYAKNYQVLSDLVLSQKADAFIGSDLTNYNLIDAGITSIEPAFTFGEPLELVFAIRKDWPELVTILDKGLQTLSQKQRLAIKEQYIAKHSVVDYSLVWKVTLGISVLLLALFWWNRLLAKKVQEGIQKYKQQEMLLIQQSKMAEMGEMIGVITHQWGQPLNAISLMVQRLPKMQQRGLLDEATIQDLSGKIQEQVQFMSQTIDDFRNFFKPAKEKQAFAVCETIETVYRMFQGQFEKQNITVVTHPHDHFEIMGYPNEFKQVVLNILNNAQDVILEKGIQQGRIDCLFETKEDWGIIRIRDNGGGIPEKLLPDKLFESYVSTKGDKGVGIGLNISKTIIESNMAGKLWVHNIEGGAEFVIELPLVNM